MIRYTIQTVSHRGHKPLEYKEDALTIILSSKEVIRPDAIFPLLETLDLQRTREDDPMTWFAIDVPDEPGTLRGLFTSEDEYRVILSPVLDVPIGVAMRDPLSRHRFRALFSDGAVIEITYPGLRARCPVAGAMEMGCGYCPGCELDGTWTCRWKWIQEQFEEEGNAGRLDQMYMYRRSYPYALPVLVEDTEEGKPAALLYNATKWLEELHARAQRANVSGFTYVSGYYTDRHRQTNQNWKRGRSPSFSGIYLEESKISARQDRVSNRATKAAEAASDHRTICGMGTDEECIFVAGECSLWRRADTCLRFTERSHLQQYVDACISENPKALLPVETIQRSILLAEDEFMGINPDSDLEKHMQFGGWVNGKWWINTKTGYTWGDHLFFETWLDLRQWVRRWAPWELLRLDHVDAMASKVSVDYDLHVLYSLAASVPTLSYSAGFGGRVIRKVSAITASPGPPVMRDYVDNDVDWSPTLHMDMEGTGRYGVTRTLFDFIEQFGWRRNITPPPTRYAYLPEDKYADLLALLKTPREE